jgi:hypothetical protein
VASIVATTSRPDDFARDASAMLVLPEGSTTLYDESLVESATPW